MDYAIGIIFVTELWISACVYASQFDKRSQFWRRFVPIIVCFYAFAMLLNRTTNIDMTGIRMIFHVLGMPALAILLYLCWKISVSLSMYYAMWAFMSWQLMSELWNGIVSAMRYIGGPNELNEVFCSIGIFGICNIVIAYTIARWMPEDGKEKIGPRQLISAMVIYCAFEVIGYPVGNDVMTLGTERWITIYLAQLLLVVILYLQSEVFKKSAMRQELAVMNLLWKKEQEQYELSRENIALINQKCHDLKHQIRAIRYMSKEEIDAYLEEMEDSIEIYESIVKSGNEVLDTILTEKSLYCRERGIIVSCVADGSQMGFINTIDLYAILGNALDNAIEAVEKFQHKEKRQIDVMIYRQQQFLVINIMNPMKERLVYETGLPQTTKKDRYHHGFGLKSIQYIVKKYDGFLHVGEEDGCFSLKILFPIP